MKLDRLVLKVRVRFNITKILRREAINGAVAVKYFQALNQGTRYSDVVNMSEYARTQVTLNLRLKCPKTRCYVIPNLESALNAPHFFILVFFTITNTRNIYHQPQANGPI